MIVIRRTIMGVAVERNLEDVVMVMSRRVVGLLVKSDHEHDDAGRGPQKGPYDDHGNEKSSHDWGVLHSDPLDATGPRRRSLRAASARRSCWRLGCASCLPLSATTR
jgi:hypothetical protein